MDWVDFLALRLHDVEYDGDSVLVVVPDEALVGVGCVSPHYSIPLGRRLARLPGQGLGEQDLAGWLEGLVGELREGTARSFS